jgi:Alginate export
MRRVKSLPIQPNKAPEKLTHETVQLARFAVGMPSRSLRYASLVKTARVTGFLALVACVSAWAQTADQGQPSCPSPPPTLPQMTYDEDVRYLENPACRTGFLDSLQFIPLRSEGEDYYLSLGGWIRERGEYVSNPNWSISPPGNTYLMQRYFLHMDLHLGERFRFFGELASSLVNGRNGGPRPGLDEKQLYVHQGFFDLSLWQSGKDSLTLRAGRQEMALGSENLVSTRDGRNIRRSLTGARLTWVSGDWTVDAFALRPTLDNTGYFNDPPNHAASFWGVYAVRPFRILPQGNVDLYYMGLDNQNVPFDGKGSGREQRETVGTRLWGTTSHWDYNDELTFQFGSFRSDAIRAWAVSTDTGYRVDSIPFSPRFGIRAVALSGNQNPSSRTVGTFNSIYEQGPYFSYAELFARRNLIALQPSAELKLSKTVSLTANPAFFWRESTSDGLYAVSGAVLVSGLKSSASYVATQASVQLKWKMNRNLTWFTEYGHFFPGQFLKQSTPGRNINFWTAWLDMRL